LRVLGGQIGTGKENFERMGEEEMETFVIGDERRWHGNGRDIRMNGFYELLRS
jgi:hypothetical protein